MMLLLGCVVMCEGKGPLIEKMKGMELLQQQALVAHIQQVTCILVNSNSALCFWGGFGVFLFLLMFVYVLVVTCVLLFCYVSTRLLTQQSMFVQLTGLS